MLPAAECGEFAVNQCEYETFPCRADTRSVRLRCPADVLGPKAFVPRRPLHPLRLCFICRWQRKGSRPYGFYRKVCDKSEF